MPSYSQESCDPENPREHVLWALIGLPTNQTSGSYVIPVEGLEGWSEHLYNAGFRHHPELQKIEYQPPLRGGDHWVAPGTWVPMGEAKAPRQYAPDVELMTVDERDGLLDQFAARGDISPRDRAEPPKKQARRSAGGIPAGGMTEEAFLALFSQQQGDPPPPKKAVPRKTAAAKKAAPRKRPPRKK